MDDFNRLVKLVADLRSEHGCPWDKEQTLYSLSDDFTEEAYELIEAIENRDLPNICEELGDVLLHVVLHAQIAAENNHFTISDVANNIVKKIIRRHPHVFTPEGMLIGDEKNNISTAAVLKKWDEIKNEEKKNAGIVEKPASVLRKANKPAPTLIKSERLQSAAAKVGFDWDSPEKVLDKVDEELIELKDAGKSSDKSHITEEIGDMMFALVNLARHYEISADDALKDANKKFARRFEYIEAELAKMGKTPQKSNLEEMDSLWNQIRQNDKMS